MSESAKERGERRSIDFRRKVEDVMEAIEREMDENESIYPHNKGAISIAEISRRAGVHETTFHSPIQREFGNLVKAWLKDLKKKKIVGPGPIRKNMVERVAEWKKQYEGLAQSHRDTELLLQATEAELERLRIKYDLLSSKYETLLKVKGDGKVVSFLPNIS